MRNFKFFIICAPLHRVWCRVLCSVLCVLFYACATAPSVEDINQAEAHYKLGFSYFRENKVQEAFLEFQKAIKLNPREKASLNALGNISARFKEYDKAISYYERAISVAPNYSDAMNNLGVAYLETGRLDNAIKYFQMALKNPLYATPEKACANLGLTFYQKGDYVNATKTLEDALAKYQDFPQLFYVLGLVYVKLGKTEPAIVEFKKALDAAPKYMTGEYIDVHWELANAYLRIGEIREAVKHFKIISESNGNDEMVRKAHEYIELLKE